MGGGREEEEGGGRGRGGGGEGEGRGGEGEDTTFEDIISTDSDDLKMITVLFV